MSADPGAATHEVTNQPPALEGYDVFADDTVLVEAVEREGAGWAAEALSDLGRRAGSAEAIEWGTVANANPPQLKTHDRFGHRIDEVTYHPYYHRLMEVATGAGLHGAPWADDRPGAHVARAAGMVVWSQTDAGHTCPISMTYSVVPALRNAPALSAQWEPKLTARSYEPALRPGGAAKASAISGMGMTEKQGGSDVRANSTSAEPVAPSAPGLGGTEYRLTGHKWFCSAPMSDLFLVLARAPGGLTCFAVPRILDDASRNPFRIQRLKDKLGDRSNASSEVEFAGTAGWRVGDEGRGVPTIIEMVNHTRLDCVLGSTAILRQGTAQALHHTAHRSAFGKRLADQPLMQQVLADLAIESEAATVAALRLARAFDTVARGQSADGYPHERLLQRLATPVVKYWVCKRAPVHAAEALESHGGNGFVEESGLPRLFRQSPLNGIWEGSGNVICLDVLRAMARSPEAVEAFFDEVGLAAGADSRLNEAVARLGKELADLDDIERRARRLVEAMALVFQGSLLVRFGDPAVADAFCRTRLDGDWGHAFGTLPAGVDAKRIMDRHTAEV